MDEFSEKDDQLDAEWSVPKQLEPTHSRLGAFIGVTVFALLWNGILSIFVFNALFGGMHWMGRIGLGLFLIPFLLIGLVAAFGVVYLFLTLFNPRVKVAISSAAVPLGGTVDIAWDIDDRREKIRELVVEIQGWQVSNYRRGTSTHMDRAQFAVIPVVTAADPQIIKFGEATVQIPRHGMHSWKANWNEVQWNIVVKADIPFWPNIQESFPFRVTPATVTTTIDSES